MKHFKESENNFINSGRYIPCLLRLHVNHYCLNMTLYVTTMPCSTNMHSWWEGCHYTS